MYILYIKKNTKALVQNNNEDFIMFDNKNNLNLVLKTKNNLETINKFKNKIILSKNIDSKNIKLYYLELKEKSQKEILNNLLNKSYIVYTKRKSLEQVDNTYFIRELYDELNLINIYLKIRYTIIHHKNLNIKFNENEDQKEILKFLNLCFSNIKNPETFVNLLAKKENEVENIKQKNLKYKN